MNDFLHNAYMQTTYAVYNEATSFFLKANTINTSFTEWCKTNTINSWAIITAFNPYSKELTQEENKTLNSQLKDFFIKNNISFYDAKGIPDNEDWTPEDSFFIYNISLEEAKHIGTLYKQNAIVYGTTNNLFEIIWLV